MTRERRPMPEWKRLVDRDMRLYLTWERVIEHQRDIIRLHELTGTRTTPVYQLREGSSGGPVEYQAEKITIDKEFAKAKIEAGTEYRKGIEETVRLISEGDRDRELFIRRYFLTTTDLHSQVRAALVTEVLDFLAHHSWKTGRPGSPNRTFYRWKDEIYDRLGEAMGYR